jgi:hypothetical protein
MLIASGPLGTLFAQSTNVTAAAADPVTTLEKFTVKGIANEDQIMPTVRPIGSVMGDDRSILDTPRAVSSISKQLMEQLRIKSVADFAQFAPSTYAAARYGLATTPMVRGDLAELYFDGQRAKYSRDSVQPSFNGVEALDIVKGPGSAVYGPQSNGAAGYTNFVMKKPYFDKQHTEFAVSYAGLTADKSYSNIEWQVDTSGPLSDATAYRASYLGRNGQTYYQNTKDNTQDIYLALTHKFDKTLTLNWWFQAYHQDYGEVSGINRVTQDLIDHNRYISGVAVFGPAPANAAPYFVTGIYTIANPKIVTVKAWQSVVGTSDIAHADRFQTQFVFNKDLGAKTYLKNSTFLETRTSSKYEPSITYSEYVKTDWNMQNRTEYHTTIDSGGVSQGIITGIDLKAERLISYQSFFGEEYDLQDVTQPSSTWSHPGTNIYVFGVPGHNKFGSDVGYGNYGGNQDSLLKTAAAFFQDDIKITSQLSLIAGYRIDHIKADDKSPEFVDLGGYGSPGKYYAAGSVYNVGASVNDTSYFLSSVYKLDPLSSLYVTYNRVNAITGSANFGGINTGSNSVADLVTNLKGVATLFEVGYKFVLLDNKLYNTVSFYRQLRSNPDITGHLSDRIAKGVEFESVYQISKNISFLGNFTYQDVFNNGSSAIYEQNADVFRLQPNGSYVGLGTAYSRPVAYYRRYAGTPKWLSSARLNYRFENGFSFGIGPQFTGAQLGNSEGTIHIPTQFKINATVAYSTKSWIYQVNIDNLTNQKNWTVGDPDFTGNTIDYAEKPLTVSFTSRYRF